MSAISPLASKDFIVADKILQLRSQVCALVMFYSTRCPACTDALPVFKAITSTVQGCRYGMINVTNEPDVVYMSKQTANEIRYVPIIVLYYQGKPVLQYTGKITIEDLRKFLMSTLTQLANGGSRPKQAPVKPEETIPAYAGGKPVCRGDVCYLNFDTAYEKKS